MLDDPYSLRYGKRSQQAARRYSYALRLGLVSEALHANHCQRILDVGTASGDYAVDLRSAGFDVICCDVDRPDLLRARRKDTTLQALAARARQLPFEAASFDAVIILNAFRYFDDPLLSLNECHRVLKAGGLIIMIEHNRRCPDAALIKRDVVRYYTPAELRQLLKRAGFIALEERTLFIPPAIQSQRLIGLAVNLAAACEPVAHRIYPEVFLVARKE